MLDYKGIKHFFKNHPDGVIRIVQCDSFFDLSEGIDYFLDSNSITFLGITFTDKIYGNRYVRKGNFMIPFHGIIRVEYLTDI